MKKQIKIEYPEDIKNIEETKNIKNLIEKVLGVAFKKEDIPYNFFVLIAFSAPDEIKKKNKEFRNVDKTTDVLTFPMFQKEELENIIKYHKKLTNKNVETKEIEKIEPMLKIYLEDEWLLGEIFINLEQLKKQANEYNHSLEREIAYIVVHGFYHLLGEDHIRLEDKDIMRRKEEELLTYLDILR